MKMKYKEMHTIDEWNHYISVQSELTILLLKHSTACPISAEALREFSLFCRNPKRNITCLMVKVIQSRQLSNDLAEQLHIIHQSPQIILIHNQLVVWNDSHWNITYERIEHEVYSRV